MRETQLNHDGNLVALRGVRRAHPGRSGHAWTKASSHEELNANQLEADLCGTGILQGMDLLLCHVRGISGELGCHVWSKEWHPLQNELQPWIWGHHIVVPGHCHPHSNLRKFAAISPWDAHGWTVRGEQWELMEPKGNALAEGVRQISSWPPRNLTSKNQKLQFPKPLLHRLAMVGE